MALNGAQHAQIQKALLAAFDEAGLRQLVAHELDADLDAVAGGDNTTELAFNLVRWAQQTGCVRKLIDGGLRQNAANPALQALAQAAKKWRLDEPPPPSPIPDPVPAPAPVAPQPGGLKLGGGVWIAAGLALGALLLAAVFWPRPLQSPALTATPNLSATPATPVVAATVPATVIATAPAGALAETPPPTPTSTPSPLAVAVEPFTACAEPNPATALHAQLQTQLRQNDAEAAVQLTLLSTAGGGAAAEPPYAIVLGGSCAAGSPVVYTADIPLVGDGRSERVAEPARLELPWPDAAPPAKTLAALLIYHAQEGSYNPVALLNQEEAAWGNVPEDGRLFLHWLMGNALLDNPNRREERAREQYQQALDLVSPTGSGPGVAAQLYNNRGWSYHKQALDVALRNEVDDIVRTLHLSATHEFSRAVELDASYGMAWVNLGETYVQLDDYGQAAEGCEQALDRIGDFVHALICKAKLSFLEGEYTEAVQQAQRAMKSDDQQAFAYYMAGVSHCYLRDAGRARSSLLSFLEWYPTLSRWDRDDLLLEEAITVLERIDGKTMCQP